MIRRKSKKGEAWARQRITASLAAVLQREMALAPDNAVWSYLVQRGSAKGQRRPITVSGFEVVMNTTLEAASF